MSKLREWFVRERAGHSQISSCAELSNRELLARLFRDPIAATSLVDHVPLHELVRGGTETAAGLPGVGAARLEQLQAALELATRILQPASDIDRPTVACSQDAYRLVKNTLEHLEVEHFVVLLMDAKNRITAVKTVSQGSRTECHIHPREVFCEAVRERSVAVLVAHNHPSGDPTPSQDDFALTTGLHGAGDLLGIPLLDHLIIGMGSYRSMVDLGFLTCLPPKTNVARCGKSSFTYRKT